MRTRTRHLCQRGGGTDICIDKIRGKVLSVTWACCDHPRARNPELEAISAEMRTFYAEDVFL